MNIEQLIDNNKGLIYKMANKFNNLDKDDLFQVGAIGIIKAAKNYVNTYDTKFSTYACDYIFGEMYNYATNNKLIKISREVLKLRKVIEETKIYLTQKLGYNPSITEIALFLEKEESEITNAIQSSNQIMSLDYNEELNLHEIIPDTRDSNINDKIMIDDSFKVLTDEEKQIIDYRYYQDYTQQETANILGISQVKVSRREKTATNKMYQYLSE